MSSEYGGIKFRTGTGGNELTRINILVDGKVGIGTSTPDTKLEVFSATDDVSVTINTDLVDGGAFVRFRNDAQHWRLGVSSANSFTLFDNTGNTTPFVIKEIVLLMQH